ncbi:MAG TPA: hypothetical protein VL945_00875 [Candidatus Saccharimonadales bacterium]|nr:hypothetical protein [Candidatus Saccharimonadales bacterium]
MEKVTEPRAARMPSGPVIFMLAAEIDNGAVTLRGESGAKAVGRFYRAFANEVGGREMTAVQLVNAWDHELNRVCGGFPLVRARMNTRFEPVMWMIAPGIADEAVRTRDNIAEETSRGKALRGLLRGVLHSASRLASMGA